jgi:hypothetical protein
MTSKSILQQKEICATFIRNITRSTNIGLLGRGQDDDYDPAHVRRLFPAELSLRLFAGTKRVLLRALSVGVLCPYHLRSIRPYLWTGVDQRLCSASLPSIASTAGPSRNRLRVFRGSSQRTMDGMVRSHGRRCRSRICDLGGRDSDLCGDGMAGRDRAAFRPTSLLDAQMLCTTMLCCGVEGDRRSLGRAWRRLDLSLRRVV